MLSPEAKFGSEILFAEGAVVFRSAACVLTMQQDGHDASDWNTPVILGTLRNVDVVLEAGKVVALGAGAGEAWLHKKDARVIDASRLVLMPGLVDAHNHPVFAGSRAKETVLKSQGLSYEEISSRGGGIAVTTRLTREASTEALEDTVARHAQASLARGVVLMEAKTGYGLSPAEETRHLQVLCKVIEASAKPQAMLPRIAPTLLGPHAASPDFRGLDAYIQALVETLPQCANMVKPLVEQGICQPLAADIFVERNYFTKEQGEKWLGAALGFGVDAHIHADEFSRSGGSELALALARRLEQTQVRKRRYGRVLSVNHCQYATEADLTKLNLMGVAAVALPTTSFFSNIPYVEAMKWRASGIRVAIGTDFNPGSAPFNNIWFAAHLALTRCGFSLSEVLAGVTFNAAYALGAEDTHGRLSVGGLANLIAFDGTEPEDFFASPLGDHLRYVVRAPSVF